LPQRRTGSAPCLTQSWTPGTETEPPLGAAAGLHRGARICRSGPRPRKGAKLPAGCQRGFWRQHRQRLWDPAGRQTGLSLARQAPTIRAS